MIMARCFSLLAAAMLLFAGTVSQAGQLEWSSNYEQAKQQAVTESKPLLIMFTASWCGPCKIMKSTTLSDQGVEAAIAADFVPVMIDTDANRNLTRKFGVTAMPTVMVVHPVTETVQSIRGYKAKPEFLTFLNTHKNSVQLASGSVPAQNAAPAIQPAGMQQVQANTLLSPFCLVSVVEEGKLVPGKPEFALTHDGLTVQFSSAEKRDQFSKAVSSYWPQLQGNCPVTWKESGKQVRGEARWAVEYDNQLYFCQSRELAQQFLANPAQFSTSEVKVGKQTTPKKTAVN